MADRNAFPWRSCAIGAFLLVGTSLGGLAPSRAAEEAASMPANPVTADPARPALPDFADLVTRVRPAVVSVTTQIGGVRETAAAPSPSSPPPFGGSLPHGLHPRRGEIRGSGFFVDAEGTLVTNNHVVKDARSVSVTLDDGTVLPATVTGRDPRTDIAVLKVDAHRKVPFIHLGNSGAVRPGQWVVAMGDPFGLGGTVTAGIVSASGRDIGEGPYDQFIQIDAPINHGNSGGPLFAQDGMVVGMNSAIYSPSGGSVGIGFAIPSDVIRTVVAELEKNGHVTRGYIGVEAQKITPATAEALGTGAQAGALIADVQADGPGGKAGLQPGDVVQTVNGQAVKTPRDLALQVSGVKPGNDAVLQVLRDGQARTVSVKVREMSADPASVAADPQQADHRDQLGLVLAPLTPENRSALEVPDSLGGAVVSGVRPGSLAEQAGVRPGDVILAVGTQTVQSPGDAARALLGAADGKRTAVALRVLRNGAPMFVGVRLGQPGKDGG